MHDKVVHCKKEKFDVYIGRSSSGGFHYGNPWSHRDSEIAIKVNSRGEAIHNFSKWINKEDFFDVEPLRRDWILRHLENLRGKILGCWCAPGLCHGEILIELLNKTTSNEIKNTNTN